MFAFWSEQSANRAMKRWEELCTEWGEGRAAGSINSPWPPPGHCTNYCSCYKRCWPVVKKKKKKKSIRFSSKNWCLLVKQEIHLIQALSYVPQYGWIIFISSALDLYLHRNACYVLLCVNWIMANFPSFTIDMLCLCMHLATWITSSLEPIDITQTRSSDMHLATFNPIIGTFDF